MSETETAKQCSSLVMGTDFC